MRYYLIFRNYLHCEIAKHEIAANHSGPCIEQSLKNDVDLMANLKTLQVGDTISFIEVDC